MKLSDAVDIVRRTALNAATNDPFDKEAIIRAIRFCGEEFCRKTDVARKSGTVDTTADTAEVSLSSLTAADGGTGPYTNFRAEYLIRAELQYKDQGTWATSTAYSVNELVQGDGDPDAKYYVCITAHTSDTANDQPGDGTNWTTYWRQVAWKRNKELMLVDFGSISNKLESTMVDDTWVIPELTSDEPTQIALDYPNTAYLWPVPDSVYTLRVTYRSPFVDTDTGDPTLNIPDEYVHGILQWGAPAALQHTSPENRYANDAWAKWQGWLRDVGGDTGFGSRGRYTQENEVL